jgi:hypothetical protein
VQAVPICASIICINLELGLVVCGVRLSGDLMCLPKLVSGGMFVLSLPLGEGILVGPGNCEALSCLKPVRSTLATEGCAAVVLVPGSAVVVTAMH